MRRPGPEVFAPFVSILSRLMDSESSSRQKLTVLVAGVIILLIAVVVVAVTNGDDSKSDDTTTAGACTEVETPPAKTVELKAPKPGSVLQPGEPASAVVETSCGSFTIALDTQGAPKTANSFAYLAEQGVFADTYFHRIVPDFVIQGGDPQGSGMGGPGYSVTEKPPAGLAYKLGDVAMAKTGNDPAGTSGSQFFVITGSGGTSLPPDYARVGKVDDGMDVIEKIGQLGGPDEKPTQTVVIDSVTIEKGT